MRFSQTDLTGDGDYLTSGETAIILRKRLGLTQHQMAERMGKGTETYARIERDELEIEPFPIPRLESHEKCMIYRRRVGFPIKQVAEDLGLSRVWVSRMENGHVDCSNLVFYWET